MTSRTTAAGRLPKDVRARERLREAQAAESRALAKVCAAGARRTAAEDALREAEAKHAAAQGELVEISGLNRAAALLSTTPSSLRRSVRTVDAVEAPQ